MNIENYFEIAKREADSSNCLRRHIGAVIVKNGVVVGRGANRTPKQKISCSEKGWCIRNILNVPRGKGYDICSSVHAEINAIISAPNNLLKYSTMYLVGYEVASGEAIEHLDCCENCKSSIIKAGIEKVYIKQRNNQYLMELVRNWV